MTEMHSGRNIVEVLAEEFVERYRRGDRPPVTEYTQKYPQHAAEIEDLFPALLMMENLKPVEEDAAAAQASHLSAAALDHLGDYRIIREVGRGGMGIVYEAEQVSLGRHVALKVLPKELLKDSKQRLRFEREARAAAKLHHTNIVPVFGVGEDDGMGYYVMQFIQGLALDEVLEELKRIHLRPGSSSIARETGELRVSRRDLSAADVAHSLIAGTFENAGAPALVGSNDPTRCDATFIDNSIPTADSSSVTPAGRLSDSFVLSGSSITLPGSVRGKSEKKSGKQTYWHSVARIGVQVAEALAYAHGQGILHRDIKPANLLLDIRGTVWVTDFGLAKLQDDRGLTQTGDILGTLRYMAPETFKGNSDARSEIYSLGLTLYELLALRPAFEQTNRNMLVDQVMFSQAESLGKRNPEIPSDLQTIVHKAIERDPQHRYQSAQDLADDLQRFIDDEPIRARRISLPERMLRWSRHNKGLAASLCAVSLLISVLAIGSTIAAGYFRQMSRHLEATVADLTTTEANLRTARIDAENRAAENAGLAGANASLAEREAGLRVLAESREQAMQATLYAAEINLAGQASEEVSGIRRVQELLGHWSVEQGRDHRGWEWYYLSALCHQDVLTIDERSGTCADWSPDGTRLAIGCRDGQVRIFDPRFGTLLMTLAPGGDATCIAFSPDGSKIAVSNLDRFAHVWDATSGKRLWELQGDENSTSGVAWSPDGQRLATASTGRTGECILWNVATGERVLRVETPIGESRIDWSPDGSRIVVAGRLIDIESGRETPLPGYMFDSCTFSPDGRWIAGLIGHEIEICSVETQHRRNRWLGHNQRITAARWSPDGKLLATSSFDDTVRIWDVETAREVATLRGHTNWILDAQWSPDGRSLVSVGPGAVKLWDVTQPDRRFAPDSTRGMVYRLLWSDDGGELLVGCGRGIQRLDAESGRELSPATAATAATRSQWSPVIDWCDTRHTLATLHADHVELLDDRSFKVDRVLEFPVEQVRSVAVSPNGTRVATSSWIAGENGGRAIIDVVDLASGDTVHQFELPPDAAGCVAWSPDGTRLASGGWQYIVVVDAESGGILSRFGSPGAQWFNAIAWSPAGNRIAIACDDHTIRVIDSVSGQEQRLLSGHTGAVRGLTWSPTGTRIASGGEDAAVRIWNPDTGAMLLTLSGHRTSVQSVAWNPDGVRLASASDDGDIRIWDAFAGYRESGSTTILERINQRLARDPDNVDDLRLRVKLLKKLGRHADADRDRQQWLAVLDRRRREHPDDAILQDNLVDLLTSEAPPTDWSPLRPVTATSAGGAKLTALDDASVLASGNDVLGDAYTVTLNCDLRRVTTIKLETLPDASLPSNGPGRHASGNFQLSAVRLYRTSSSGSGTPVSVPFNRVEVSYAYQAPDVDPAALISEGTNKVWHVWGQTGQSQSAVFRLASPIDVQPGEKLTVELQHPSRQEVVNLGHFRVLAADRVLWKDDLRTLVERRLISHELLLPAAHLLTGAPAQAEALLRQSAESEPQGVARLALLARVQEELDQPEAARQSCTEVVDSLGTMRLSPELRPFTIGVLTEIAGLSTVEVNGLLSRPVVEWQLPQLTAQIDSGAGTANDYLHRGWRRAQLGRWADCSEDYLHLTQLTPTDRYAWMRAASVLVLADNDTEYAALCHRLIEQFRGNPAPDIADAVCKICLLRPGVVSMSELPTSIVCDAAADPQWEGLRRWFGACAALIALRDGNPQKSAFLVGEPGEWKDQPAALALVIRALAEIQLGNTEQARDTLSLAEAIIPGELHGLGTGSHTGQLPVAQDTVAHDWLIPEILRREAAAAIHDHNSHHP